MLRIQGGRASSSTPAGTTLLAECLTGLQVAQHGGGGRLRAGRPHEAILEHSLDERPLDFIAAVHARGDAPGHA